jgi:uncharacterized membrane protein YedE/YeeE
VPRFSGVLAGLLLPGVAMGALGGCSSGVVAPSDRNSATPVSFSGSFIAGGMTVLVTKYVKVFVTSGARGLSAAKKGGTWTVTVSGTRLTDAVEGATISVNGHLTCTKVLDM